MSTYSITEITEAITNAVRDGSDEPCLDNIPTDLAERITAAWWMPDAENMDADELARHIYINTTHDISAVTTDELVASIRAGLEQNDIPEDDMHVMVAVGLIQTGEITPDWNDGTITNLSDALAFGALISGDERIWV